VAFANLKGGTIFIGVADDGFIEGVQREDVEEWLMNICSHNVIPAIIPFYEKVQVEGKTVAVLKIPKGAHKPYQTAAGKYLLVTMLHLLNLQPGEGNREGTIMDIKERPNHKIYIQVLRQMSPEKRLLKAFELSEFTRQHQLFLTRA